MSQIGRVYLIVQRERESSLKSLITLTSQLWILELEMTSLLICSSSSLDEKNSDSIQRSKLYVELKVPTTLLEPPHVLRATLYLGLDWGLARTLNNWPNMIAKFRQIWPKGLYQGWARTLTYPMWRPRWHNFGAKILGRLEETRMAFPWPELPTWDVLGTSVG